MMHQPINFVSSRLLGPPASKVKLTVLRGMEQIDVDLTRSPVRNLIASMSNTSGTPLSSQVPSLHLSKGHPTIQALTTTRRQHLSHLFPATPQSKPSHAPLSSAPSSLPLTFSRRAQGTCCCPTPRGTRKVSGFRIFPVLRHTENRGKMGCTHTVFPRGRTGLEACLNKWNFTHEACFNKRNFNGVPLC